MNNCCKCGKKLVLTNEVSECLECQQQNVVKYDNRVDRNMAQTALENIRKKGYMTASDDLNDTHDWLIVCTYINDLRSD